jgi:soluble lytic murein transglycosylase-like protein
MIMYKSFALLLISLIFPVWVSAQQPLLSPPDRSPVPLSDSDQLHAEAQSKAKPAGDPSIRTASVTVPAWPFAGGPSSGDGTIDALVREAALRYGVDPRLVLCVMQAESGFRLRAVSPKGATGLMQLMPGTAARLGVTNIFDVRENIFGGVKYLRWLLDRFGGDVRLALAGYNAGEHAVELHGHQVPPLLETQNYVRSIVLRYNRFRGLEGLQPQLPQNAKDKNEKDKNEKFPDYNQILQFNFSTDAAPEPASRKP